ncbi:MAG: type II toxin-antitoxin system RelE/ParE family toxin [Saprospiraceae bacterium]|nr:type II toxin-antitoxin system RelE/ParE family toxin [Saprospiraceae bacterium]MBK7810723.1 type II toxin-antitoxin system RelE/ParE family toxin [Saprospiraceae bacterium]MBK9631514.1 type II toxin-antitoxin system RelE/ParE family toxin [Saprospiraceae bacterium]
MNIYFTRAANLDLEIINSYLSQNWGLNSRLKFESKLGHILNLLLSNSKLGILENIDKNIYSILVHKHIRVYYRLTTKKIIILSIFDVRQNPNLRPT